MEARYHQKCLRKLHNPGTGEKKGRPQNNNINTAMENVFSYIENHEDCQFTLSELKQTLITDFKPDNKTIKKKLVEKYADRIVITAKIPGPTIISFRDSHYNTVLTQMKQSFKNNDPEAERRGVLVAAASILRQDECTQICETKYYTTSTCLFDNLNENIPESIIFFIDVLILKKKKEK